MTRQTVAEVRYGAIAAGWGERRLEAVERLLRRSRVLPVDDQTIRWQLPLVAHDAVILDCPDLQLLTELPRNPP